ncbi:hypothetical protein IAI18_05310 [Acetobacteraceae bacterium H6797]|nr:hypothetical protein [Acetobacteraceae bacterium H6797]
MSHETFTRFPGEVIKILERRERIEAVVGMLVDLLDELDAPAAEMEPDDEDACMVEDAVYTDDGRPGDRDDAEPCCDDEPDGHLVSQSPFANDAGCLGALI